MTKIHCLADGYGGPVSFALTSRNVADITIATPLLTQGYLSHVRLKRLLADKAYDANSLRKWLKLRRIKAVMPSTATRTKSFTPDQKVYRRKNLIERLFGHLKNWRKIAAEYDRLAKN